MIEISLKCHKYSERRVYYINLIKIIDVPPEERDFQLNFHCQNVLEHQKGPKGAGGYLDE